MQNAVQIDIRDSKCNADEDNCDAAGKRTGAKRKRALSKDVVDDGEHQRARLRPHFKENQKDVGTSRSCRSFFRRTHG